MANPVFEPFSAVPKQDSLPQLAGERSEDSSEMGQELAVTGDDIEGNPAPESVAPSGPIAASAASEQFAVQVCYATPEVQTVIALFVTTPCTIKEALRASGLLVQHPEIDLSVQAVGIFGKLKQLDDLVAPADRIEIYRPLIVDPKVARARRVAKTRKGGSSEGRKWSTRARRSL